MTRARTEQISLSDTPYYHCMARCVRRAFLFGEDSVTGRRYDHRKQWVVTKLAELSSLFAMDVCAYAVMSNHYHVVLKVDVDECSGWSDREVAKRWTVIFSGNVLVNRFLDDDEMSQAELDKVTEFIGVWRERLCDISWFMRCLNESIARMANEEDDCRGRFWEGRFKSQALLDEAAVLACMAYVDLNPVRAGICDLPEDSDYTSIQKRIKVLANAKVGRPRKDKCENQAVPLLGFNKGNTLKEDEKAIEFSLDDYMQLIDWTGRAVLDNKRGSIAEGAPKILARLGMSPQKWLKFVPEIEKSFTHAVGCREKMQALANKMDISWLRGQRVAKSVYGV